MARMLATAAALATSALAWSTAPPLATPRALVRLHARTAAQAVPGWRVVRTADTAMVAGGLQVEAAFGDWTTKTVKVSIARSAEAPGIGLLLEEFNADDTGAGLTLVEGLAAGGNAELSGVDVLPGDAIVSAGGANTEGYNYDLTVGALGDLPAAPAPAELVLKRLVRRPFVTATVRFPPAEERADEQIKLFAGSQLRRSMYSQGIACEVCNGDQRCCGACTISVIKGADLLQPKKTQEEVMLKAEPRWRMSCKAYVKDIQENGELIFKVRPGEIEECDVGAELR